MATPRIGRQVFEQEHAQPEQAAGPVEAGECLLEYLPRDAQELIREAAQHLAVPVWQMLLGYAMRCYDGALTYSPFLLAAWASGGKPDTERPCVACHVPFVSRFPDAQFCCDRCSFGKLVTMGHSANCPTGLGKKG